MPKNKFDAFYYGIGMKLDEASVDQAGKQLEGKLNKVVDNVIDKVASISEAVANGTENIDSKALFKELGVAQRELQKFQDFDPSKLQQQIDGLNQTVGLLGEQFKDVTAQIQSFTSDVASRLSNIEIKTSKQGKDALKEDLQGIIGLAKGYQEAIAKGGNPDTSALDKYFLKVKQGFKSLENSGNPMEVFADKELATYFVTLTNIFKDMGAPVDKLRDELYSLSSVFKTSFEQSSAAGAQTIFKDIGYQIEETSAKIRKAKSELSLYEADIAKWESRRKTTGFAVTEESDKNLSFDDKIAKIQEYDEIILASETVDDKWFDTVKKQIALIQTAEKELEKLSKKDASYLQKWQDAFGFDLDTKFSQNVLGDYIRQAEIQLNDITTLYNNAKSEIAAQESQLGELMAKEAAATKKSRKSPTQKEKLTGFVGEVDVKAKINREEWKQTINAVITKLNEDESVKPYQLKVKASNTKLTEEIEKFKTALNTSWMKENTQGETDVDKFNARATQFLDNLKQRRAEITNYIKQEWHPALKNAFSFKMEVLGADNKSLTANIDKYILNLVDSINDQMQSKPIVFQTNIDTLVDDVKSKLENLDVKPNVNLGAGNISGVPVGASNVTMILGGISQGATTPINYVPVAQPQPIVPAPSSAPAKLEVTTPPETKKAETSLQDAYNRIANELNKDTLNSLEDVQAAAFKFGQTLKNSEKGGQAYIEAQMGLTVLLSAWRSKISGRSADKNSPYYTPGLLGPGKKPNKAWAQYLIDNNIVKDPYSEHIFRSKSQLEKAYGLAAPKKPKSNKPKVNITKKTEMTPEEIAQMHLKNAQDIVNYYIDLARLGQKLAPLREIADKPITADLFDDGSVEKWVRGKLYTKEDIGKLVASGRKVTTEDVDKFLSTMGITEDDLAEAGQLSQLRERLSKLTKEHTQSKLQGYSGQKTTQEIETEINDTKKEIARLEQNMKKYGADLNPLKNYIYEFIEHRKRLNALLNGLTEKGVSGQEIAAGYQNASSDKRSYLTSSIQNILSRYAFVTPSAQQEEGKPTQYEYVNESKTPLGDVIRKAIGTDLYKIDALYSSTNINEQWNAISNISQSILSALQQSGLDGQDKEQLQVLLELSKVYRTTADSLSLVGKEADALVYGRKGAVDREIKQLNPDTGLWEKTGEWETVYKVVDQGIRGMLKNLPVVFEDAMGEALLGFNLGKGIIPSDLFLSGGNASYNAIIKALSEMLTSATRIAFKSTFEKNNPDIDRYTPPQKNKKTTYNNWTSKVTDKDILTKQITALDTEIKQKESKRDELERRIQSIINDPKSEVKADAIEKLAPLMESRMSINDKLRKNRSDISTVTSELEGLNKELNDPAPLYEDVAKEISQTKSEIAELEQKIAAQQKDIEDYRAKTGVDEFTRKKMDATTTVNNLMSTVKTAQLETPEQEKEYQSLLNELLANQYHTTKLDNEIVEKQKSAQTEQDHEAIQKLIEHKEQREKVVKEILGKIELLLGTDQFINYEGILDALLQEEANRTTLTTIVDAKESAVQGYTEKSGIESLTKEKQAKANRVANLEATLSFTEISEEKADKEIERTIRDIKSLDLQISNLDNNDQVAYLQKQKELKEEYVKQLTEAKRIRVKARSPQEIQEQIAVKEAELEALQQKKEELDSALKTVLGQLSDLGPEETIKVIIEILNEMAELNSVIESKGESLKQQREAVKSADSKSFIYKDKSGRIVDYDAAMGKLPQVKTDLLDAEAQYNELFKGYTAEFIRASTQARTDHTKKESDAIIKSFGRIADYEKDFINNQITKQEYIDKVTQSYIAMRNATTDEAKVKAQADATALVNARELVKMYQKEKTILDEIIRTQKPKETTPPKTEEPKPKSTSTPSGGTPVQSGRVVVPAGGTQINIPQGTAVMPEGNIIFGGTTGGLATQKTLQDIYDLLSVKSNRPNTEYDSRIEKLKQAIATKEAEERNALKAVKEKTKEEEKGVEKVKEKTAEEKKSAEKKKEQIGEEKKKTEGGKGQISEPQKPTKGTKSKTAYQKAVETVRDAIGSFSLRTSNKNKADKFKSFDREVLDAAEILRTTKEGVTKEGKNLLDKMQKLRAASNAEARRISEEKQRRETEPKKEKTTTSKTNTNQNKSTHFRHDDIIKTINKSDTELWSAIRKTQEEVRLGNKLFREYSFLLNKSKVVEVKQGSYAMTSSGGSSKGDTYGHTHPRNSLFSTPDIQNMLNRRLRNSSYNTELLYTPDFTYKLSNLSKVAPKAIEELLETFTLIENTHAPGAVQRTAKESALYYFAKDNGVTYERNQINPDNTLTNMTETTHRFSKEVFNQLMEHMQNIIKSREAKGDNPELSQKVQAGVEKLKQDDFYSSLDKTYDIQKYDSRKKFNATAIQSAIGHNWDLTLFYDNIIDLLKVIEESGEQIPQDSVLGRIKQALEQITDADNLTEVINNLKPDLEKYVGYNSEGLIDNRVSFGEEWQKVVDRDKSGVIKRDIKKYGAFKGKDAAVIIDSVDIVNDNTALGDDEYIGKTIEELKAELTRLEGLRDQGEVDLRFATAANQETIIELLKNGIKVSGATGKKASNKVKMPTTAKVDIQAEQISALTNLNKDSLSYKQYEAAKQSLEDAISVATAKGKDLTADDVAGIQALSNQVVGLGRQILQTANTFEEFKANGGQAFNYTENGIQDLKEKMLELAHNNALASKMLISEVSYDDVTQKMNYTLTDLEGNVTKVTMAYQDLLGMISVTSDKTTSSASKIYNTIAGEMQKRIGVQNLIDDNPLLKGSQQYQSYLNAYQKMLDAQDQLSLKGELATEDEKKNLTSLKNTVSTTRAEFEKLANASAQFNNKVGDNVIGFNADDGSLEEQMKAFALSQEGLTESQRKMIESTWAFQDAQNGATYSVSKSKGQISSMSVIFDEGSRRIGQYTVETKKYKTGMEKFMDSLKGKYQEVARYLMSFGSIYRVWGVLKQGVTYIRDIDSALTELKKVTDETEETYDKFLKTAANTADKVGSTIKEVVSSTADWARIGYSMEDAAKLAENTSVLLNVSEFQSIDEATNALTSTLQAFGYTADESLKVVDVLNEVGELVARR